MNVFARALEIPRDPFAAIDHLWKAMSRPERVVNLGLMDDRYFSFSAGCGFDAEAAELVESEVANKKRFGEIFFYWGALRVLAGAYRHRNPTMVMKGPFGEIPVAMAIACNAGPYAYLAGRGVAIAPEVRLEGGLDVFALKRMRIESLPWYTFRSLGGKLAGHRDAVYERDLSEFEIRSETPFHRHVDGEPLEPATSTRLSLARERPEGPRVSLLLIGLPETFAAILVRRSQEEEDEVRLLLPGWLRSRALETAGRFVATGSPGDADLIERAATNVRTIVLGEAVADLSVRSWGS